VVSPGVRRTPLTPPREEKHMPGLMDKPGTKIGLAGAVVIAVVVVLLVVYGGGSGGGSGGGGGY